MLPVQVSPLWKTPGLDGFRLRDGFHISLLLFYFTYKKAGEKEEYGKSESNPLLLRFLPVLLIQYGMACLGVSVVMVKNKETLSMYGLTTQNIFHSIAGCILCSIPTVVFLFLTNDIHGFFPFQGMFLTKEIVHTVFPINILGYSVIALVWGFGEGLYYVILANKINSLSNTGEIWNAW